MKASIRVVIFDYGGVVADEGFATGLRAIAREHGRDPDEFFAVGDDLVYRTGYVTGQATEHDFWHAVRRQTEIDAPDAVLTEAVLSRFTPRPAMLELADRLRERGIGAVILSDQSDWLDRLDARYRFSRHFDRVFNSYHLGTTKKDPDIFPRVAASLNVVPGACLFIDDNPGHLDRAAACGMAVHRFSTIEDCRRCLVDYGLLGAENRRHHP